MLKDSEQVHRIPFFCGWVCMSDDNSWHEPFSFICTCMIYSLNIETFAERYRKGCPLWICVLTSVVVTVQLFPERLILPLKDGQLERFIDGA